ncbi:MAG: TetR family transcriptional regulator [Mycobacterium sp.]
MSRPAPGVARRRRERGSINADEIVNGAFEVAAEVSLDHLSMPMLAKHLGVGVTSIYWYFRKKDDLLDAMADRALREYKYTDPSIDAKNWRESLRKHARTMRQTFRNDPVLCDLILIRGTYSRGAARNALEKIESPVAALVQAGMSPQDAFDTYAAIAAHTRGQAVLQRLQDKMARPPANGDKLIDEMSMPLIAEVSKKGHRIGAADDINFDFILDSILDRAEGLITDERGDQEG